MTCGERAALPALAILQPRHRPIDASADQLVAFIDKVRAQTGQGVADRPLPGRDAGAVRKRRFGKVVRLRLAKSRRVRAVMPRPGGGQQVVVRRYRLR